MKNNEKDEQDIINNLLQRRSGSRKIAACMYSPIEYYLRHALNNSKFELSPDRLAVVDVAVEQMIKKKIGQPTVSDFYKLKDHLQAYFYLEACAIDKIPVPSPGQVEESVKIISELIK